jgi:hypothetical protein
MTDGLVKRLRGYCDGDACLAPVSTKEMIDCAADRIEELEKALIRVWVLNQGQGSFKSEIDMVVSAAMDGKTDD